MFPGAIEKERAKRIIVEIVRQAGGSFRNKTNLYKAFYYAHLKYAEVTPSYLSFWPIVRMPRGPGIHNFDTLLGELLLTGIVHVATEEVQGVDATVFELTELAGAVPPMHQDEIDAIAYGVSKVDGMTASQASHVSHKDSRAWRSASDGAELNIYTDLLSDEEFQRKRSKMRELSEAVQDLSSP